MTLFELYRQVVLLLGIVPDEEIYYKAVSYAMKKRKRIEAREDRELDDDFLVQLTVDAVAVVEFSDFCSEVEQTLSELRQGA